MGARQRGGGTGSAAPAGSSGEGRRARRHRIIIASALLLFMLLASGVIFLATHTLERDARRQHAKWVSQGFSTVYGRLHNKNGRAVRLNGDILLCGQACFSATPTVKGEFAFSRIPSGRYRLYGVHRECTSEELTLLVGRGGFTTLSTPLTADSC